MRKRKTITVPLTEWEQMKKQLTELTAQVETMTRRDKDYLTSTEVCSMLQISHTEFCRYQLRGVIHTAVIGGKLVVNKDELQAVIASGRL